MLTPRSFSKEWITQQLQATGARDATNLEKCILSLELVGRLAQSGLDFVFKGGTCLVLHLHPIRRLSIDVDIASLEPLERVQQVLADATRIPPFTGFQHQTDRDAESPPTKHFRISYSSQTRNEPNDSLQLDVLEVAAPHPKLIEREISTDFVEVETPVTVRIPNVDCMLGDKLAAFAPKTIGVLYAPVSRRTGQVIEPRPIKIMKQLFDVGELFNEAKDLDLIARTYQLVFEEQNRYRGGKFTLQGALDDTIEAAFVLSQIDLRPIVENAATKLFRTGVRSMNNHLFAADYSFTRAKIAAAHAGLLAAALKSPQPNRTFQDLRCAIPQIEVLKESNIDGQLNKLNGLKKTSPEAFYRWYQAHRILNG